MQSHLSNRFLRGASWSLIGSLLAQGITLVTMLFVIRLLGKETYGQFVLIQNTLATFGIFAGFGIGATATRYVAALKNNDKARLGRILALSERTVLIFGLIALVVIALFSRQLATSVLNSPSLTMPLAIAAVAVFFATIDGYQTSIVIGFESMRVYAIGSVAGATATMPILLIAAGQYGLDGMAFALATSTFIRASISRILANGVLRRNGVVLNVHGYLKEWLVLRDFALPALLAGAMVTPAHWICQAMLANTQNGFAEVAVLGVAMQWFSAVLFLPMVASKVVAPMLTESVASGNHADSKRILILAIKANAIVTLPIAAVIAFLSPLILSAYGAEFENSALVLIIAIFTATLVAVMAPVGNVLAAHSKMWVGMAMNLGWFASYLFISFIALDYGAIGIASAMGAAYLLHLVWVSLWTIKNFAGRS